MSTLMKNDKTIAGLVEQGEKMAQFTLQNENVSLNTTVSQITEGTWTSYDNETFSVSGATLTIKKAGIYAITNESHALINANSYIRTYVSVMNVAGSFALVDIWAPQSEAIQGKGSGATIVKVPANSAVILWGVASDASNLLFGRSLTLDNRLTVCKIA